MSGPWEDFAPSTSGAPWEDFIPQTQAQPAQPQQSAAQVIKEWLPTTWPVRAAKAAYSALTLPGDVYYGKADPNTPEGFQRVQDLAMLASPVNPAVRAGEAAVPLDAMATRQMTPQAPTADALKASADQAYDAIRNMGVDYSGPAVANMAGGVQRDLEAKGILRELAPKTFNVLDKLQDVPDGGVAPFSGLQAARRSFGFAGKDFNNPTEQLASSNAKDALDAFLGSPGAVVNGPGDLAAGLLQEANANYAASKRADLLAGKLDTADLRAAAANSGQNTGNTIRQRAADVVLRPKEAAGFSPEEIQGLTGVSEGTPIRNTARWVGNFLGGGGGLGGLLTAGMGGVEAGIPGAVVPVATGIAAKQLDNYLTRRAMENVGSMTRQRSPLFEQLQANAPYAVESPARRSALLRALGLSADNNQ